MRLPEIPWSACCAALSGRSACQGSGMRGFLDRTRKSDPNLGSPCNVAHRCSKVGPMVPYQGPLVWNPCNENIIHHFQNRGPGFRTHRKSIG